MRSHIIFGLALVGCASGPDDRAAQVSADTSCSLTQAGDGFTSEPFAAQTGRFSAELDATPSIAPIDSVIALSNGAATQFSDLAAVVRFNPSGMIDVRSGSTYRADVAVSYTAGTSYHFKLDVDLAAHTYDVRLRGADGSSYIALATNYPFRSEQANVAQLDHVVTEVDSSDGSVQVCGFIVAASPPGCATTVAGAGFAQQPVAPASGVLVVELAATPSANDTDAVIALSSGPASTFNDLAVAVRFATSGVIDARDGDTYSATNSIAYQAGAKYQLRFVIDVGSHTYSAFALGPSGTAVEVAHDFAFRPTRAVTSLDTLDSIVDTSDGATLGLCDVGSSAPSGIAYVRDFRPSIALLPNDEVIANDGTTTMHLDATGTVVGSASTGGEVAVDGTGNVTVASATNGTLTLVSYTPTFGTRWTTTSTVGGGETVVSAGTDAAGNVMVATASGGALANVYQLGSDGAPHWSIAIGQPAIGATAVAFARDGFVFAYPQAGGIVIQHQSSAGQPDWSRTFAGQFTVVAMATDPAGDLAFTGSYDEDINFDPGTVTYHSAEIRENTYVALLGPDTTTVLAQQVYASHVYGVATNGSEVAVSGEDDVGPVIPHLRILDRTGNFVRDTEDAGLGDFGRADQVWLAASGRSYWSRSSPFPEFQLWPYFVALNP